MSKGERGYWVAPRSPRLWEGSTVFILGGGPSLSDMDLSLIEDENVLGVNDAYTLGPWVDAVYFNDAEWFKEHRQRLEKFHGLKFSTNEMTRRVDGINCLYPHLSGISLVDGCCALNKSSGGGALNLAVILGAVNIVLLGYDMHAPNPHKPNWHDNNIAVRAKPKGIETRAYELYRSAIARDMVPGLSRLKIKVYNATPNSSLDCFPMVKLKDVASTIASNRINGNDSVRKSVSMPPVKKIFDSKPSTPYVIQECICGSSDYDEWERSGENNATLPMRECVKCGAVHQKVLKSELDGYYEHGYSDRPRHQDYDHDRKIADLRLNKYDLECSTLLDVGSGNGAFVDACCHQGIDAWGVDPGTEAFDYKVDHTYPGYLNDIHFPSGHFDAVTIHDVFEHVPDIKAFMKEVVRVTADDGRIIIDIPDFWSDDGQHHWKKTEHLWYLTETQLTDFFEEMMNVTVDDVDRPIPGKLVFSLTRCAQERKSIIVPPGVGDIYWVFAKLESMIKREGMGVPNVYIQNSGKRHRRSETYVQSVPFVRFAGYVKMGFNHKVFRKVYHTNQQSIIPDVAGKDYFIGFNGRMSPRRNEGWQPQELTAIHPELQTNWFHDQFVSLSERQAIKDYQETHGDYVVAYFVDHGMYDDWLQDFGVGKIKNSVEQIMQRTGYKVVLTGAHWDRDNSVNRKLKKMKGVIDLTGQTNLEQAFALIKGSKGMIGFPSGLPFMSVKFKVPTLMLWSQYFKHGFWTGCVPTIANGRWYEAMATHSDPVAVADKFVDLMEKNVSGSDKPFISCVYRSGGDYSWSDVERLSRAVQKHTTIDYQFVCLTDDVAGHQLSSNIIMVDLLNDWPGWWSKLELFRKDVFGNHPVLYLDLDTVIVDNIDHMLQGIDGLSLIRDLYRKKELATGLMAWRGDYSEIYNRYKDELSRDGSDQTWLRTWLPEFTEVKFLQDRANIYSYKKHCRNKLPKDAQVVCFHGKPRPIECGETASWFVDNWRDI